MEARLPSCRLSQTVHSTATRGGALIATRNDLAHDLAAKLIAHLAPAAGSEMDYDSIAGALNLAALKLSRWVGSDGCSALVTRSLNRAAEAHPALRTVKVITNSAPMLDGVEDSVAATDAGVVAVGLTAALVELFALLVRVVGADLTMKLVEQMTANDANDSV